MTTSLKLKEFGEFGELDEYNDFGEVETVNEEFENIESEDLPVEDQIAIARTHTESLLYIITPDRLPMVHYLLKMVKIELDSAENGRL